MSFTHLHLASGFSFKYGTTLPHLLVEKARDFGMSSLALTDRDGLYGAIRFEDCARNIPQATARAAVRGRHWQSSKP